jgi:hypothetical protein
VPSPCGGIGLAVTDVTNMTIKSRRALGSLVHLG